MDVTLTVTGEELSMIIEALDCYEYWDLGAELPRNDGRVFVPGDYIGGSDPYWTEPPSGAEVEAIDVVRTVRELSDRLLKSSTSSDTA